MQLESLEHFPSALTHKQTKRDAVRESTPAPSHLYTLQDFMAYPNLATRMTLWVPFIWSENRQLHVRSGRYYVRLGLFVYGLLTCIYQIIALAFYVFMSPPQSATGGGPNDNGGTSLAIRIFESTSLICYFSTGIYKMWNIFIRRDDISKLLDELKAMFPTADQQQANNTLGYYPMGHYWKISNVLMQRTWRYFMFAYFYYNIVPIIQLIYEYFSPEHELSYSVQSNGWYPFHNEHKHDTFIGFLGSFICHSSAEYTSVSFIMCGEFHFCYVLTQLKLHFDYLVSAFERIDPSTPNATAQLKALIYYHNRLLRLYRLTNSIFNFTFFMDLTIVSVALCLMGLSMLLINLIKAIMYSAGFSFFLVLSYIFCSNGNQFTTVSDTLHEAAFHSNWQDGTLEYRRMISFFIMSTSNSLEFKAYGYIPLSMETYMSILKLAYQLFTFFSAMDL